MSIFSKMFRDTMATRELQPEGSEGSGSLGANWRARVSTPRGDRSLIIPTWYRCTTLIMETVGQMSLQFQKKDPAGQNFVEDDYGIGKWYNFLFQVRPNPLMTASTLWQQVEFRKIYYGNAYIYVDRDFNGVIQALWLCYNAVFHTIGNTYDVSYYSDRGPISISNIPASEVLHFKNTILGMGMDYGKPVIDYALKSLELASTSADMQLQDLAKGGRHKVIVKEEKSPSLGMKGRASLKEMEKVRDNLASDWETKDVMLMSNIADVQIVSQTAQQLQLLESRGFSNEELCRMLGIPKILAMIGDGGSYKMPEHAQQEFLQHCIQPRIDSAEDELNSKILSFYDFKKRQIKFSSAELRRLDPAGQANIDLAHLKCGWSLNEIRGQYNLAIVEGGDIHYLDTNLAEVGSEKLRGAASGSDNNNTNNGNTGEGDEE